jgi:hypothetical protein
MLIDYSIRSFELLERVLTRVEKAEVFDVFYRMGNRMGLSGLPESLDKWERMRAEHLQQNLQHSPYTSDLFRQYRKHLGPLRYYILVAVQGWLVPRNVRELLGCRRFAFVGAVIKLYKFSRALKLDGALKSLLLPSEYKKEIRALGSEPARRVSCPHRGGQTGSKAGIPIGAHYR